MFAQTTNEVRKVATGKGDYPTSPRVKSLSQLSKKGHRGQCRHRPKRRSEIHPKCLCHVRIELRLDMCWNRQHDNFVPQSCHFGVQC
jgi:hypothetical protein